jgi:hypothetical protein
VGVSRRASWEKRGIDFLANELFGHRSKAEGYHTNANVDHDHCRARPHVCIVGGILRLNLEVILL